MMMQWLAAPHHRDEAHLSNKGGGCMRRGITAWATLSWHTWLSTEQEASQRSSGDQATSSTLLRCPRSVLMCFQFSTLGWSLLPKARAPAPARSS